jgi:hypothetical protein
MMGGARLRAGHLLLSDFRAAYIPDSRPAIITSLR